MFVTLPSNASTDFYPENKVSDFKVHLPKELDLNGSWEVGIAEIFYPNSWYNVDSDSFWIYYRRGDVDIRTTLPGGYYQKESEIVKQLLKAMKQDFELKNKQLILEKTLDTEVAFSFDIKFNNQTQLCEFHIRHNHTAPGRVVENLVGKLEANVTLNVSEALANILGFSQKSFNQIGVYTSERVVDINAVTAIYVYCDIIQYRTVGHALAPLLSVIPVEGRSGARISKRYEKIQYHPVLKKNIADIHISLRDDQGSLIRFRKGKVIVTLHFRPKKFGEL